MSASCDWSGCCLAEWARHYEHHDDCILQPCPVLACLSQNEHLVCNEFLIHNTNHLGEVPEPEKFLLLLLSRQWLPTAFPGALATLWKCRVSGCKQPFSITMTTRIVLSAASPSYWTPDTLLPALATAAVPASTVDHQDQRPALSLLLNAYQGPWHLEQLAPVLEACIKSLNASAPPPLSNRQYDCLDALFKHCAQQYSSHTAALQNQLIQTAIKNGSSPRILELLIAKAPGWTPGQLQEAMVPVSSHNRQVTTAAIWPWIRNCPNFTGHFPVIIRAAAEQNLLGSLVPHLLYLAQPLQRGILQDRDGSSSTMQRVLIFVECLAQEPGGLKNNSELTSNLVSAAVSQRNVALLTALAVNGVELSRHVLLPLLKSAAGGFEEYDAMTVRCVVMLAADRWDDNELMQALLVAADRLLRQTRAPTARDINVNRKMFEAICHPDRWSSLIALAGAEKLAQVHELLVKYCTANMQQQLEVLPGQPATFIPVQGPATPRAAAAVRTPTGMGFVPGLQQLVPVGPLATAVVASGHAPGHLQMHLQQVQNMNSHFKAPKPIQNAPHPQAAAAVAGLSSFSGVPQQQAVLDGDSVAGKTTVQLVAAVPTASSRSQMRNNRGATDAADAGPAEAGLPMRVGQSQLSPFMRIQLEKPLPLSQSATLAAPTTAARKSDTTVAGNKGTAADRHQAAAVPMNLCDSPDEEAEDVPPQNMHMSATEGGWGTAKINKGQPTEGREADVLNASELQPAAGDKMPADVVLPAVGGDAAKKRSGPTETTVLLQLAAHIMRQAEHMREHAATGGERSGQGPGHRLQQGVKHQQQPVKENFSAGHFYESLQAAAVLHSLATGAGGGDGLAWHAKTSSANNTAAQHRREQQFWGHDAGHTTRKDSKHDGCKTYLKDAIHSAMLHSGVASCGTAVCDAAARVSQKVTTAGKRDHQLPGTDAAVVTAHTGFQLSKARAVMAVSPGKTPSGRAGHSVHYSDSSNPESSPGKRQQQQLCRQDSAAEAAAVLTGMKHAQFDRVNVLSGPTTYTAMDTEATAAATTVFPSPTKHARVDGAAKRVRFHDTEAAAAPEHSGSPASDSRKGQRPLKAVMGPSKVAETLHDSMLLFMNLAPIKTSLPKPAKPLHLASGSVDEPVGPDAAELKARQGGTAPVQVPEAAARPAGGLKCATTVLNLHRADSIDSKPTMRGHRPQEQQQHIVKVGTSAGQSAVTWGALGVASQLLQQHYMKQHGLPASMMEKKVTNQAPQQQMIGQESAQQHKRQFVGLDLRRVSEQDGNASPQQGAGAVLEGKKQKV